MSKTPNTIEEAIEQFNALTAENEKLSDENKSLSKANKKLAANVKEKDEIIEQIRKAQGSPAAQPTFELGGKTYAITSQKFRYDGKNLTASDLIADKELQAELLEIGAGFIKEISE